MASPLDEHYQRILDTAEPDLRTLYPFGIVAEGNKWVRARRGEGARKLGRLLADKEARQTEPPMLGTSGGYTTDPRFALGKRRRHAGEFGEPEPAAPYPDDWKRQNDQIRLIEDTQHTIESLMKIQGEQDALKIQLESHIALARQKGLDVRGDVKVIERRIDALGRKLGLGAAA